MRGVSALLLVAAAGAASAQQFVTVAKDSSGVWWFNHKGKKMITMGINHVNNGGQDDGVGGRESVQCKNQTKNPLCGDTLNFCPNVAGGFAPYFNTTMARYGSGEAWASASLDRIQSWGMNTVGGWSATIAEKAAAKRGMYYAHLLDIGTTWLNHLGLDHDVFSQAFVDQCHAVVRKEVLPRVDDEWLLGWQLDNEILWSSLGLGPYLFRPAGSAGYGAAISMLQQEYGSVAALSASWGVSVAKWSDAPLAVLDPSLNKTAFGLDSDRFLALAAGMYFNITSSVVRAADPNHLILGARNAGIPEPIIRPMGRYVDVIDKHEYSDDAPLAELELLHNLTGRPVYVSEFSFTAIDSNLPNTRGARMFHPYATQSDRATGFRRYADALVKLPYAVGYHWWQYNDECATGRWPDGEDSNYGVVSLADEPYAQLTEAFAAGTAAHPGMHAASGAR